MIDIDLKEYDYDLPDEKIARHPVEIRDHSKLLYYNKGVICEDSFNNIDKYIPEGSLLVFNNTSVIRARLFFTKNTGAEIEILCLEPFLPSDYEASFSSVRQVIWKCLIGNLKKWKGGIISKSFEHNGNQFVLNAEKTEAEGESWRVRFSWDCPGLNFGELIERVGHIPLPPYLNREEEEDDLIRYQTVYSSVRGSVAAPTAGLHFTSDSLEKLRRKEISWTELTLHVGAGTFQPVKNENVRFHRMHSEFFSVRKETIEMLLTNQDKVVAVGTTSVRTLESLYWLGNKIIKSPGLCEKPLFLDQWDAYNVKDAVSPSVSLTALLNMLNKQNKVILEASTSIMIVPGYNYKVIKGMITNFHQPRSTLLLLVSAWIGDQWKSIYRFALDNNFRFLSYGDCSLLIK